MSIKLHFSCVLKKGDQIDLRSSYEQETKFTDTIMGLLVTSLADKQPPPSPTSYYFKNKIILSLE